MTPTIPITRDLVLIGGGHTHALVLRRWGMDPLPGARLTLIDPGPVTAYTGMLPGVIAGHYARDESEIDLVRLARFAGARLVIGAAMGLDLRARAVRLQGRPPIAFDVASLDVGITSAMPEVPGFEAHGTPAKPLGQFAVRWLEFRRAVASGECPPKIAVIGGGVGGIELSMAMQRALALDGHMPGVTVIDRTEPLDGLAARPRRLILAAARERGIVTISGGEVASIDGAGVDLADGRRIEASFVAGVAGARPHDWLADTGLRTRDGYPCVDAMLRTSEPDIFAAGDCAHLSRAPRAKAGVFAVREGPILHANLRAVLGAGRMRRYRPQTDYLKLVSLGGTDAVAARGRLALRHPLLWRWKNRIDRRFIAKLTDLPTMEPPQLPHAVAAGVRAEWGEGRPHCAGCGAKVGPTTLAQALADAPPARRGDVERGVGDDAAILKVGPARQAISTDHLRALTDDPWRMARIAAIHALSDIRAMGAAPQAVLASIVLPPMDARRQSRTLGEIMAGARAVFDAADAEIVGGHTSTGAEMILGFTVTGLLTARAIGHAGARPGDVLILTKPIGTGVVMAGEMAGRAHGREVKAAIDSMDRDQAAAAAILTAATAMTDVTGFGLAGHLGAICRASDVSVRIDMDEVPFLSGAERLARAGIRSTLWPQNRAAAELVRLRAPDDPRADLFYDPQTAGGLLAAVGADIASKLVERIEAEGGTAWRIGVVRDGPPSIDID